MSLYITDENGELHKIAGAGGGAGSEVIADSELNTESTNPVQNKVLYNPVTFAELERQKSKNLFDINAPFFWAVGHTFVNGNTITVEAGGSTEKDTVFALIPVKENTTYYIGANASKKRLLFRIYDENKNVITSAIPNWVYNQYWEGSYADFPSTEIRTQLTIPSGAKYLAFCTAWLGSEQTFSNVIISEYPDVENYQPYNGPIVHEKDIEYLKQQPIQAAFTMSADQSNFPAYTNNTIEFTSKSFSTDLENLISVNNGIFSFNKKVKKVKFKAFVVCTTASATVSTSINIYKNGSEILGYPAVKEAATYGQVCIFETPVIEIAENDTLRTTIFSATSTTVQHYYTKLLVEVYV